MRRILHALERHADMLADRIELNRNSPRKVGPQSVRPAAGLTTWTTTQSRSKQIMDKAIEAYQRLKNLKLTPVVANGIYHGGLAYHPECTRGPSATPTFAPGYAGPLTAEQVRQIVREELARLQVPNASGKPTTKAAKPL